MSCIILFHILNSFIVGSSFEDILETELSDSMIQDAVDDDEESCGRRGVDGSDTFNVAG